MLKLYSAQNRRRQAAEAALRLRARLLCFLSSAFGGCIPNSWLLSPVLPVCRFPLLLGGLDLFYIGRLQARDR